MKVLFWIHRFDAEKTASIMKRVFKKKPYIKVGVEDGHCILNCHDMGTDATTHFCDFLVNHKGFMGRFHSQHPDSDNLSDKKEKYEMAACRFGFWDLYDYPNDIEKYKMMLARFNMMRAGVPMYQADMAVFGVSHKDDPEVRYNRFATYVYNLVKFHGKTEDEAKEIIEGLYPGWGVKPPKKVFTKKQKLDSAMREAKLVHDLIEKLKFMGPKHRRRYLRENFIDEVRFKLILKKFGRDWVMENIGPVPGITD